MSHRHRSQNNYLVINRVTLSSGKDKRFEESGYYASSELNGGPDTFWKIAFHTTKVTAVPPFLNGAL